MTNPEDSCDKTSPNKISAEMTAIKTEPRKKVTESFAGMLRDFNVNSFIERMIRYMRGEIIHLALNERIIRRSA